ncbi:hypothetical protein KEM54_000199 [Ascosphaera aggregata]|nr:hypothetical protein KEM54_000199 [Ascosphaera aggregata]
MATMADTSYTVHHQTHPIHFVQAPERSRQKKMSLTQTFFLACSARAKLSRAASQPDHDLRLLVGHANLLDALMLDLNEAEEAQKRWYSQCAQAVAAQKASRQQGQQQRQQEEEQVEDRSEGEMSQLSTKHIKWADEIETHHQDWDEKVISDDSSEESDFEDDGDDEEEEEKHLEYSYPEQYPSAHKTSATHKIPEVYYGSTPTTTSAPQWSVSTHEIAESDTDDEDGYAIDESYDEDEEENEDDQYLDAVAAEAAEEEMNGGLSLRRVSSHGPRAPDLLPPDLDGDAEESSDDEPLLSPPQEPMSYTSETSQTVTKPNALVGGGDNSKDSHTVVAITVKPLASPPLPGQPQHDDSLLPHEEGDSYFPTPIRA